MRERESIRSEKGTTPYLFERFRRPFSIVSRFQSVPQRAQPLRLTTEPGSSFFIYIYSKKSEDMKVSPRHKYNKQMNYKKIRRTNYRAFVAGPTPAIPYNIRTTVYIVLQLYIKNINGRLKLLAVYSE